jgi:eukaryotic-like serine/threonine-protein kinase
VRCIKVTDSKLDRSVAIKLLPEAFAHNSERAARFEREARVVDASGGPVLTVSSMMSR